MYVKSQPPKVKPPKTDGPLSSRVGIEKKPHDFFMSDGLQDNHPYGIYLNRRKSPYKKLLPKVYTYYGVKVI